jgi:hypothetical protein
MSAPIIVPIKDCVGEALRFARAQWRLALIVGGAGAATLAVSMLLLGPFSLLALFAVLTACHTALVSAALRGPENVRARLGADSLRVGGAMAIVGLIVAILLIATAYIAMAVLIAPYAEQAKAAGQDEAQLEAIMRTAIAAQPYVAPWALGIGAAVIFFFTTRLFAAAPASVDRARVTVFESWRMSRGQTLRIMGARILLLAPALILVGAVQSLMGLALGFTTADPAALMAQSQANPALFMVFFALAVFVQLALFGALEAGLSVALYRRLSAPAPGL